MPLWRRCFAVLNWRPVYDIEMRGRESEILQMELENKRLAELNSRMDTLLLSADSSSQAPPAIGSN